MIKELDKLQQKSLLKKSKVPQLLIHKSKTFRTDTNTTSDLISRTLSTNTDKILRTQTTKTNYDITFRKGSDRKIIVGTDNFKINTLCKTAHECMDKKSERNVIENYVDKIEDKLNDINSQIEEKRANNDLISEENLKIVFDSDKIKEENALMTRQIIILRQFVENLKQQIIENQKEKNIQEVETIKTKEEILQYQDMIKKMKEKINVAVKENTKLKFEVEEMKKKVETVKAELQPFNERTTNFVKDVVMLIKSKK